MRCTAAPQRVAMSYCQESPQGGRQTRRIGLTCVMSGLQGDIGGTGSVLPGGADRGDDGPMRSRTDYCPIAVGVDVLGDRWTPLIIRELMVGARGFNEIHRGIPRVSRTLLAQRLRDL
jgi:hypothetical protein